MFRILEYQKGFLYLVSCREESYSQLNLYNPNVKNVLGITGHKKDTAPQRPELKL